MSRNTDAGLGFVVIAALAFVSIGVNEATEFEDKLLLTRPGPRCSVTEKDSATRSILSELLRAKYFRSPTLCTVGSFEAVIFGPARTEVKLSRSRATDIDLDILALIDESTA